MRDSMAAFKQTLSIEPQWTVCRSASNFFLLHHQQLKGKQIADYLYQQGYVVKAVAILGDHRYIRICVASEAVMQQLAASLLLIAKG